MTEPVVRRHVSKHHFLSRMSGSFGTQEETIIHNEGSDDEERIVTEAHIQAKSGFFEIDTPIYDADVVDVGVDPRDGSRDRRLVTNLKLNQVTGRSSNIQHTQVQWAKAPAPRVAAVRRLTFENLHPDVLKAAGARFAHGHHRTAVAEAFKVDRDAGAEADRLREHALIKPRSPSRQCADLRVCWSTRQAPRCRISRVSHSLGA